MRWLLITGGMDGSGFAPAGAEDWMRTLVPGLFPVLAAMTIAACVGRHDETKTPVEVSIGNAATPVGTSGDSDGPILTALDERLDEDSVLRERDIMVEVVNGVETVWGAVRSQLERDRVTEIARKSPGIRHIVNILEVHAED